MTIRASCGCLIQNSMLGVPIRFKEYDREGNKSVGYGVFCQYCAKKYEYDEKVLHNEDEEREWVESDYKL